MPNYKFILASFHRAFAARDGGQITGQDELVVTLPNVTKDDEFSFASEGSLLHRHPLEDQKREAMYNFDWKYSARTPMVAFLNLSLSTRHIIEEIQAIRRGFPFAIFILYGSDSEYQAFFNELEEKETTWLRHFYTLLKDRGETFWVAVRDALDKGMATAINKINKSTLFSAFISYSHKDQQFADWLHNQLRRAGIKCWLDEKQLRAGDRLQTQIEKAIYDRDKILLCASKHSLTSWWVDNEINSVIGKEQKLWKERGKETLSLIPLNLDGFLFSDEWQSGWKNQIKSRLAPDFTDWRPDHYYEEKHGCQAYTVDNKATCISEV